MIYNHKIAALCIAKVYEEENMKLISAINDSLVKNGYRLFIYNTCTDLFWGNKSEIGEKDIYNIIDFSVIDALIVCDNIIKDRQLIEHIIENAKKADVPVFSLDGIHKDCINISFDYNKGFEMIVRHITDFHKCTKVHYMGGIRGNTFSEDRRRIIQKVLAEKGIEFTKKSVSYGDFWSDPCRMAMEDVIARGDIPEAVICANDTMAITVCSVLNEHGYKVPDDVLVTGFDGLVNINFSTPRVTSCSYSYSEMGDKIFELLDRVDKGENCNGDYYVGFNIILHESCGCQGGKSISPAEHIDLITSSFYRYQREECSIYNHVANIYCCQTVDEICNEIAQLNWYGLFVLLNSECTDNTINPLTTVANGQRSDDMCLLYTYNNGFKPKSFKRKDIAPEMEYLLQLKNPIIFNSLNFQNIPLGYICFFFDTNIRDYCRIPQIVNALNVAVGGYRNLRYQKFLANKIEEISRTDTLTGLYNRKGFADMLSETAEMFSKNNTLTIVSADLDGLKHINDSYGHSEGDFAIRAAAEAIEACLPGKKICARFGGDEFAAITDEKCADTIKAKIYKYLDEYNAKSQKEYKISLSIGAYEYNISNTNFDFDDILKNADSLMYIEKYSKPNRRK